MENLFKVKIRNGEFEIEIESSNKEYISDMLEKYYVPVQNIGKEKTTSPAKPLKSTTPTSPKIQNKDNEKESTLDVAKLVGDIKDSEEYDMIEKYVLDKHDQLHKIMMCIYFSKKLASLEYITTGQIETITNEFGVKVKQSNASSKITSCQKYFTGKVARKKGLPVPYKLNRKGEIYFEEILKGNKPEK